MPAFNALLSLFTLAPSLRRASGKALSVYVPGSPQGYDTHLYDLEFGHLLRRFEGRLGDAEREVLDREFPRLRAHIGIVRPAGCPAVVGFADEGQGVLELIPLCAPTEARLEVGDLLLAPVLRQLEDFPPALVAVVDKEEALTFGVILAAVTPLEHLAGLSVRHTRAGGTSASSNQRRADNRARTNLERAALLVRRELESGAYQSLFIAGPAEARVEFEALLPEAVREIVTGHLGISLDSPHLEHDVLEKLKAWRT